jgi:hypothetical protein
LKADEIPGEDTMPKGVHLFISDRPFGQNISEIGSVRSFDQTSINMPTDILAAQLAIGDELAHYLDRVSKETEQLWVEGAKKNGLIRVLDFIMMRDPANCRGTAVPGERNVMYNYLHHATVVTPVRLRVRRALHHTQCHTPPATHTPHTPTAWPMQRLQSARGQVQDLVEEEPVQRGEQRMLRCEAVAGTISTRA